MFVEKICSWKGMPQEPAHDVCLLNLDTGMKLQFFIMPRYGGLSTQKNASGNVISHNGCIYKLYADNVELMWSTNRQDIVNLYEEIKREWTKGQFIKVISIYDDV